MVARTALLCLLAHHGRAGLWALAGEATTQVVPAQRTLQDEPADAADHTDDHAENQSEDHGDNTADLPENLAEGNDTAAHVINDTGILNNSDLVSDVRMLQDPEPPTGDDHADNHSDDHADNATADLLEDHAGDHAEGNDSDIHVINDTDGQNHSDFVSDVRMLQDPEPSTEDHIEDHIDDHAANHSEDHADNVTDPLEEHAEGNDSAVHVINDTGDLNQTDFVSDVRMLQEPSADAAAPNDQEDEEPGADDDEEEDTNSSSDQDDAAGPTTLFEITSFGDRWPLSSALAVSSCAVMLGLSAWFTIASRVQGLRRRTTPALVEQSEEHKECLLTPDAIEAAQCV